MFIMASVSILLTLIFLLVYMSDHRFEKQTKKLLDSCDEDKNTLFYSQLDYRYRSAKRESIISGVGLAMSWGVCVFVLSLMHLDNVMPQYTFTRYRYCVEKYQLVRITEECTEKLSGRYCEDIDSKVIMCLPEEELP